MGRSTDAAEMPASRARRRVRGETATPDPGRHREVVDAFLAASRAGDFDALLALLDPDVVLRADQSAAGGRRSCGGPPRWRARRCCTPGSVATTSSGCRSTARSAGLLAVTVSGGLVVEIDVIADPERLARLV